METLRKITRRAEKLDDGSSRWWLFSLISKQNFLCVRIFSNKAGEGNLFSYEKYSYLLGDETKHKYAVLILRTTDALEPI